MKKTGTYYLCNGCGSEAPAQGVKGDGDETTYAPPAGWCDVVISVWDVTGHYTARVYHSCDDCGMKLDQLADAAHL